MPIEPLSDGHDLTAFDCGRESLNTYLKQNARQKSRRDLDRTFVLVEDGQVVGYYTLVSSELVEQIPNSRAIGRLPRRVGVILLGRIAVDKRYHKRGFGDELLFHAFRNAEQVSQIVGAHAVYLDVEEDNLIAKAWYADRGFEEIPNNPTRMFLRMSAIRELKLNEDN